MTYGEYAASKGITLEELQRERMAFLQCEGYDDAGNEYETLDAWIARRPTYPTYEPMHPGMGLDDNWSA